MKSKKKIITILSICIVIVLLAGVAVYGYTRSESEETEVTYKETAVERGNLTVGVTESGSVEIGTLSQEAEFAEESTSSTSTGSMAGMGGNTTQTSTATASLVVEEVYVTVGQTVAKGDPLLKISEESIAEYREDLETAVDTAQTDLNEANLNAKKKQLEADYNYDLTILNGELAEANYNAALKTLQDAIDDAQDAVDEQYQVVDYLWNQVNNGDSSKADQLAEEQEKYEDLQDRLTAAQNNYTTKSVEAKKTYEEAMLNYSNADSQYKVDVNGIDDDITEASEALADAKEALETFETFVGNGTIYAEYSGVIMTVGCSALDELSNGTVIAEYADGETVTMTVSVSQEDISDIAIGDVVDIEMTAYEDQSFEGVVSAMDTSASSGSSTVSYNVTVTFTGDVSGIYTDMTGNVTFIQKQVSDVIYVSNKAVINEGTASYVKIKNEDGSFKKVEVITGFSDGVNVEIVSGLKEGQTAIIESRVVEE